MINIFDYSDYRLFLKEKYLELKATQSGFSYRYFSMKCGYKSPNFLKLVIDGSRNLSSESIAKFSVFFKFSNEESVFFERLVLYNQAKNSIEKDEFAQQLLDSTLFKRVHPLGKDKYLYYSNWYNIAIREILSLNSIGLSAQKISQIIYPQVDEKKVAESLKLLERLELIEKKNNLYKPTSVHLTTGDEVRIATWDEVSSSAIKIHHHKMLALASHSLDTVKASSRDISSVTIAVESEKIDELKAIISRFRKEVLALSETQKKPDSVYQLGIQIFPLTKARNE
jgi:uncharacterized protein (TIGR02147 family)